VRPIFFDQWRRTAFAKGSAITGKLEMKNLRSCVIFSFSVLRDITIPIEESPAQFKKTGNHFTLSSTKYALS
jgi:hypothetical protein